jgi:putative addiction module component (TIGR02574 family)
MKKVNISLSKLSFAEKLNLMEAIWEDLSRNEKHLESPDWHKEVLQDREKALKTGNAKLSDWEKAKRKIKRNIS